MKFAYFYEDHYQAGTIWDSLNRKEWLIDVLDAPEILIGPKCTPNIRKHIESQFLAQGWALKVKLNPKYKLTLFAEKNRIAFQLQTGNISRGAYDLIKLQYLFPKKTY